MRLFCTVLVLAGVLVLVVAQSPPCPYTQQVYVNESGSDGPDCGSSDEPCASLAYVLLSDLDYVNIMIVSNLTLRADLPSTNKSVCISGVGEVAPTILGNDFMCLSFRGSCPSLYHLAIEGCTSSDYTRAAAIHVTSCATLTLDKLTVRGNLLNTTELSGLLSSVVRLSDISNVIVSNSNFEENEARRWNPSSIAHTDVNGVAFRVERVDSVNISSCYFSDNQVIGKMDKVQGIAVHLSNITISNIIDTFFEGNHNTLPQGVLLYGTAFYQINIGRSTFRGCHVANNEAQGDQLEGTVYIARTASVVWHDTLFSGNVLYSNRATASNKFHGGAIALYSVPLLEITNCTFSENAIGTSVDVGSGAALYLGPGGTYRLNGCQFLHNILYGQYATGGAIYAGQITSLELTDCSFISNILIGDVSEGGAVFILNAQQSVAFTRVDFLHNVVLWNPALFSSGLTTVSATEGGAVAILSLEHTAIFDSCTFVNNSCTTDESIASGGALYVGDPTLVRGYVTLQSCWFEQNVVRSNDQLTGAFGGAVGTLNLNRLDILNSSFIGNAVKGAYSAHGGAVSNRVLGDLFVYDSQFSGNGVKQMDLSVNTDQSASGGAIGLMGSNQSNISRCSFSSNSVEGTAAIVGGALFFGNSPSVTISDCSFDNHTLHTLPAASGRFVQLGGAIAVFTSSFVSFSNSSFTGGRVIAEDTNDSFESVSFGSAVFVLFHPVVDSRLSLLSCVATDNSIIAENADYNSAGIAMGTVAIIRKRLFDVQSSQLSDHSKFILSITRDLYRRSVWPSDNAPVGSPAALVDVMDVTLHNMTFERNSIIGGSSANGAAGSVLGGCLCVRNLEVTLEDPMGADVDSSLSISDSRFVNCTALTGSGAFGLVSSGGALYANMHKVAISSSLFERNSAMHGKVQRWYNEWTQSSGGAASIIASNMTVRDVEMRSNSVISHAGSAEGGGMIIYAAHAEITGCNFFNNTVVRELQDVARDGIYDLEALGGAVSFKPLSIDVPLASSKLFISNSSFDNNLATVRAAFAEIIDTVNDDMQTMLLQLNSSKTSEELFDCHTCTSKGGALALHRSNPIQTDVHDHFICYDCEFDGNIAHASYATGGAIWLLDCDTVEVNRSIISNNHVKGSALSQGGGLAIDQSASVYVRHDLTDAVIEECLFEGNTAAWGAALHLWHIPSASSSLSDLPSLCNVTFENNSASGAGGAIYIEFHELSSNGTIDTIHLQQYCTSGDHNILTFTNNSGKLYANDCASDTTSLKVLEQPTESVFAGQEFTLVLTLLDGFGNHVVNPAYLVSCSAADQQFSTGVSSSITMLDSKWHAFIFPSASFFSFPSNISDSVATIVYQALFVGENLDILDGTVLPTLGNRHRIFNATSLIRIAPCPPGYTPINPNGPSIDDLYICSPCLHNQYNLDGFSDCTRCPEGEEEECLKQNGIFTDSELGVIRPNPQHEGFSIKRGFYPMPSFTSPERLEACEAGGEACVQYNCTISEIFSPESRWEVQCGECTAEQQKNNQQDCHCEEGFFGRQCTGCVCESRSYCWYNGPEAGECLQCETMATPAFIGVIVFLSLAIASLIVLVHSHALLLLAELLLVVLLVMLNITEWWLIGVMAILIVSQLISDETIPAGLIKHFISYFCVISNISSPYSFPDYASDAFQTLRIATVQFSNVACIVPSIFSNPANRWLFQIAVPLVLGCIVCIVLILRYYAQRLAVVRAIRSSIATCLAGGRRIATLAYLERNDRPDEIPLLLEDADVLDEPINNDSGEEEDPIMQGEDPYAEDDYEEEQDLRAGDHSMQDMTQAKSLSHPKPLQVALRWTLMRSFLFMLYSFHYDLMQLVLGALQLCVDGYMPKYMWIPCDWSNGTYVQLQMQAYFVLVIYVIGFPAALAVVVWLYRNQIRNRKEFEKENPSEYAILSHSIGFLYTNYKPEKYWFEFLWIIRRLCISFANNLLPRNSPIQLFCISGSLAFFIFLHQHQSPFLKKVENGLALSSAYVELLTYVTGKYIEVVIISLGKLTTLTFVVQNLLMLVNIGMIVAFVLSFVIKPSYVKAIRTQVRKFISFYEH